MADRWLSGVLLLLAGCGAVLDPPLALRVDLGVGPVYSMSPRPIRVVVRRAAGETDTTEAKVESSAPSVLAVDPDGRFRCVSRGSATVSAKLGGVSATTTMTCEPLSTLRGPGSISLFAGGPAKSIALEAVGIDGNVMPGVNIQLESRNTKVVRVSGRDAVGVGGGRATILAKAGDATTEISVDVIEVTAIEVTKEISIAVGESAALSAVPRGPNGEALKLDVEWSTADRQVAWLRGVEVVGGSFGATVLTAKVGAITERVAVEVYEKSAPREISVPDGDSVKIAFDKPGFYVISFDVGNDQGHGLEARWVGSECSGSVEARRGLLRCTLSGPATLYLNNPTVFGMGATVRGAVEWEQRTTEASSGR